MSEDFDWITLRANQSETFDCLKFTLEGAGERSDGYARTSAHAFGLLAWGSGFDGVRRPGCGSAFGSIVGIHSFTAAAQLHGKIQAADSV